MDTVVENRRGIIATAILNHLLCAVLSILLYLIVFSWAIERWEYATVVFSVAMSIYYMSRVYAYTFDQPKLDKILKKKYDYLMPLKIGGASGLIIFIISATHFLIYSLNAKIGTIFGIIARFLNFPFVYFFHGYDGKSFNFLMVIIISILPIIVSYIAYILSVKDWSLTKVHDNIVYEKRKK